MAENVREIAAAHVQGIDLDYRAPTKPEHIRASLPEPVLEENTEWLDLYWRTWSIAYDKVKTPDPATGLVPYCDAAFSDNIFQWDTCFMLRFLRYAPAVFRAYGSLDNFYRKQHDDGFICREINSISGNDFWEVTHQSSVNPPLFSDAEWSLYCMTGDALRASEVLKPLRAYHQWLSRHRRANDGVGYWTTALGSGMDNSPRAHAAGGTDVHEHHGYSWLCMTAQMALSALRISQLAGVAGELKQQQSYYTEYEILREYVRDTFWNSSGGFYADLQPDGIVSDVLTPATCWPLMLPGESEERVASVEAALLDPARLGRRHMIASLPADHPLFDPRGNYWRGSVWPPMVYLAVRAMQEHGRFETARRIAVNHLEMINDVFRETGTFWENYAPDAVAPGEIARPEFVGWTGCGPVALLIETIIGIEVRADKRRVEWRLSRPDRHGVKNLILGSERVSLVYDPSMESVEVEANSSFELRVQKEGHSRTFNVSPETKAIDLR